MGQKIIPSNLITQIWETIQWQYLGDSARVDITLLLFGLKPSVRLIMKDEKFDTKVLSTFFYTLIKGDSIYISSSNNCEELKNLDFSTANHTEDFGKLLGYPPCCSRYMGLKGEENIDDIEKLYWQEKTSTPLINTSFYYEGYALISHVPCSTLCQSSKEIATTFIKKLYRTRQENESLSPFGIWVDKLFLILGVETCFIS
jgi:hypothetical protein